jgi:hypothetical protein
MGEWPVIIQRIAAPIADFDTDLQFSLANRDEPFWIAVFRKAFPNMVSSVLCENMAQQRAGIDRIITLSSGDLVRVDQKLRRKVYSDIALEVVSVDRPVEKPGWIMKDLAIDYLAYAFLPTQRCYMYPWLLLRRAWLLCGRRWEAEYGRIPAQNPTYTTWSVPVPIEVLQDTIARAWVIQL